MRACQDGQRTLGWTSLRAQNGLRLLQLLMPLHVVGPPLPGAAPEEPHEVEVVANDSVKKVLNLALGERCAAMLAVLCERGYLVLKLNFGGAEIS
eukprot:SAG11_NODE_1268_length_5342_cov_1.710853_8_plen_95_part_00